MLKIIGFSLLALVGGYFVGLFAGMALIKAGSSNRHDKSVEAATTGALIVGPLVAILSLVATLIYLFTRPSA